MKRFGSIVSLLAGVCFMLMPLASSAQTKAETTMFNNTLRRPTVKAAERFLKKYPQSVYAPKVLRVRDSIVFFALKPDDAAGVLAFRKSYPDSPFRELADERIREHNTSGISHEEALRIAGDCLDAIGWKKDNVEHVIALDKGLDMRILSPAGEYEEARSISAYTLQDAPAPPELVLPLEVIAPLGGRNYLHFGYLNGGSEYVEVLYLPEEDLTSQAMFYGMPMRPLEGEAYRIEGQSPEMMEGLSPTAEVMWLTGRFKENLSLVQISHEDLLTDESIKWWLEKNPKAHSSASKLSFGRLDPESSIVAAYKKAGKEKGKGCSAALFDIRGYTVICLGRGGEYTLVWCEPVCRNKRTDKFLNTVYFESDGATLDLFYYKGSSTFKYRISVPSQTIRR